MIEINLLKQGHGVLYRQEYVENNVAHQRAKILLLLILLLSSLTMYLTLAKPSSLNKFIIAKLFDHLDVIWFEESRSSLKIWYDEKVLSDEESISAREVTDYILDVVKAMFLKKEAERKEAFNVRIASTPLSAEADSIQKDLLAKGFQSDRGTYKERADKFLVIIDLAQTSENVDRVLDKINSSDDAWEIRKSGNNEIQLISQSFFSIKKAEQLKELIKKKGFKSDITKINTPVVFHEVRIGNFKDREQAVLQLKKLQKEGLEGAIVKR